MPEIIVRGGTVVNPEGRRQADVAIASGQIVEIDSDLVARAETDLYSGRNSEAWELIMKQWPALNRSLAEGRLAHAYLFSGPPGALCTDCSGELTTPYECEPPEPFALPRCYA